MKHILVVDDNTNTTNLVKLILKSSGCDCIVANDGLQCLELIRKKKFNLLLLDLGMPKMSGTDVLKKLKEVGLLSGLNVILFTASPTLSSSEFSELVNDYGIRGCIIKPFTKKQLLDVVSRYVDLEQS